MEENKELLIDILASEAAEIITGGLEHLFPEVYEDIKDFYESLEYDNLRYIAERMLK